MAGTLSRFPVLVLSLFLRPMIRLLLLGHLFISVTASMVCADDAAIDRIGIDLALPDGAAWDGSRTLMVPDVKGGVLWEISAEKDLSKAKKRLDGRWAISGTCYQNGVLYFVDIGKRKLYRLDVDQQPELLASFAKGQSPNDLVVDRDDNIFITFTGEGVVRRVAVDGAVSTVVTDLVTPNGIGLSPDGRTIYVSSIRTGEIVAASIDWSKDTFETTSFAQLPNTEIGFKGDGMTLDRAGNVYCTGGRSVCVFNTDGEMIDEIVTTSRPINVVFGGDEGRRLYISTFDGLYAMDRNAYGIAPMPAIDLTGISCLSQIEYAQIDGRKLYMDVYRPDDANQSMPAIMLIHGGGWVKGSKEKFAALAASLCRRGYVVANIEYRLGYEAKFPVAVRDCNAAATHLHTHADDYGIDPTRMAVVGGSAGGHLAGLMAAGDDNPALRHDGVKGSAALAAVVIMAGPTEIATGQVADQTLRNRDQSHAVIWIGGDIDQERAKYESADVLSQLDATMPPTLFLTGSEDKPQKNAIAQQKLEKLGVATELSIQDGAKHGHWNSRQYMPAVVDAIDEFLKKHL